VFAFGPLANALVVIGTIWLVAGLVTLVALAVVLGRVYLTIWRERRQRRLALVAWGLSVLLLINWLLVAPVIELRLGM
jgi:hypothetical protein